MDAAVFSCYSCCSLQEVQFIIATVYKCYILQVLQFIEAARVIVFMESYSLHIVIVIVIAEVWSINQQSWCNRRLLREHNLGTRLGIVIISKDIWLFVNVFSFLQYFQPCLQVNLQFMQLRICSFLVIVQERAYNFSHSLKKVQT